MNKIEQLEKELENTLEKRGRVDVLNKLAVELRNIDPRRSSAYSQEALGIAESIGYKKGKADSFAQIGFAHIHSAENEKAFANLLDSLTLYKELDDAPGMGNALYNLGVLHIRLGVFDQAIESLHKSLEIRERLNDRSGMAACYFQLTYISQHFNDLDVAMENANKSANIRKEMNDNVGLAAAYMVMGEIFLKKRQFDKAEDILEKSLALRKTSPEKMGYFATLLRWTELHIEKKHYEKARGFASEGLQIAMEENVRFGVMRFMQLIARLEFLSGNTTGAKEQYEKALAYADQHSYKSIKYEIYESLYTIYRSEGNFQKALEQYELFHKLKEEVISLQTNAQLKSVQLMNQIEFARKEADIEKNKNAELKKAYSIIEDKNKEIIDSINYARRIQSALLPGEKYFERCLKKNKG
ncbi:MAG TPA: tetratricopeptide repeat protein [Bacteroidia bacterium]